MCGIVGFIDYNGITPDQTLFAMINPLIHRGPDSQGKFFSAHNRTRIAFGHTRLSIIELSPLGNQPMTFKHLTITFNGEIYNYRELKIHLEGLGHTFTSNSDTEVLLHAYEEWGTQMINKLIGMFAFAIYDQKNNEVLLVRDRTGVKPLYYYSHNGLFLFASEIKSFHKHPDFVKDIDYNALSMFFQYGYIPQPYSIFKYTYKLDAGHYLKLKLENETYEKDCYWNVSDFYSKPLLNFTFDEALEKTEEVLRSAFEYRMISDVPVGIFLSGGYDSSILAAMLQNGQNRKVNTFTIGFNNSQYNEANYAKNIASYLGTDHSEYYCTEQEAKSILPILPEYFDEPFADSSAIPTILVSQLARKKVIVALSADGGDEIFAGYNKYENALGNLNFLNSCPKIFQNIYFKFHNTFPSSFNIFDDFLKHKFNTAAEVIKTDNKAGLILKLMSQRVGFDSLNKLYIEHQPQKIMTNFDEVFYSEISSLAKIQCIDYKTYLVDDILTKVDRATMSVSLEGREPFLDHRIIELVARLPDNFKLNGTKKKYILKELAHKYIPPALLERPKKGFSIPVSDWFKGDLNGLLLEQLDINDLKQQGIFDTLFIKNKLNQYLRGNEKNWEFVWFMYCFQIWYKRWM